MAWTLRSIAPRATLAAFFFSQWAFALTPPAVNEGDDLSGVLSTYALSSQAELSAQGKNYRFISATAPISGSLGTAAYITSLNLAYQQALADAYSGMAETLGAANISSLTSVSTDNLTGTAQDAIADCKMKKAANGDQSSSLSKKAMALLDRFLADKSSKDNEQPERRITCETITDKRAIEDTIDKTIADVFEGSRVVQTVIHDGEIGVVIALSPETARTAGVLAAQQPSTAPNPRAIHEVAEWVERQTGQQPGNLMGLVGSRMFKLSNDEWAVIGFGIAPADSGGFSGAMGKQKLSAQRKTAAIDAQRELARFANTTISAHSEKIAVDNQTGTARSIELNDNETIESIVQRSTYSRFKAYTTTASKLRLTGGTQVYSQKLKDPESSAEFFLVAHAWSPSLMTLARDFRQHTQQGYSQGRSGGGTASSKRTEPSSPTQPTLVPIIEQDW